MVEASEAMIGSHPQIQNFGLIFLTLLHFILRNAPNSSNNSETPNSAVDVIKVFDKVNTCIADNEDSRESTEVEFASV